MHLTSTVKSIVLTVAFATQCVYAKSRNGHDYFDEKFCVLEWITYLKRLSLIVLMLYGVVLYYVPKSRSYARIACCILIDTVANGLKFALNIYETEYKEIKAKEDDENKELRIQELYRKIYEKDMKNYGQKYINKTHFDNDNHKSIRKHEYHRHNRRHRNANNNILTESNAVVTISPQQITLIDEKYKKDNVIVLQNISSKTRIVTSTISTDKLKNNIDPRQDNSLNEKIDFSKIEEIIDKNGTKHKPIKFKIPSQKQEYMSDISTDKKLKNKQNFDCMKYEEVAITSQLSKDCTTRIKNKQMDFYYGKLFAKRELYVGLQKGNHQFFHNTKNFTYNCYESSSITKNRDKPVLLRVVNWFFGGCPEASRRHREQIDKVEKEEIFESTNTWLL
ncbi:PREDICTED: uncharacterized protein LOC105455974 isoform X2 [Wasmannia auropunctata]|uniref:uncharacterized protein LOC105455974 isoform X2 n=1 Tax=Wasmannia auropunctata TaxID=64793 RepID=UPI0005EF92B1|nr:PREDICTED: uncharacterized protein LOC105455974 isoform X2 [Wasmannia auropunctata]